MNNFTLLDETDIKNFFEKTELQQETLEVLTNSTEYNDSNSAVESFRSGSTSMKMIGKNTKLHNRNLLINTDNTEYNDYKTTKKIKDTLRRILLDSKIECNKTEVIIEQTAELFKSLKTVARSRNRIAGLAICYYKTSSTLHTPIKATQLTQIFNCHKRDLANFIRKNDWNLNDNEYDFIVKYGHILEVKQHIEEAKNIFNVCINKVRNLIGPSSSKISTMSASVWLYVLGSKYPKYTSSFISSKLDVGKASICKYYKYIMANEAKIISLVQNLSINTANRDDLATFNTD